MTLQDKFYLRFGLLHGRYGRIWAGMLAFLAYAIFISLCLAAMYGAVELSVWWFELQMEDYAKQKVQHVQAEKVKYEKIIIACLSDGGYKLDGKMRPCSL